MIHVLSSHQAFFGRLGAKVDLWPKEMSDAVLFFDERGPKLMSRVWACRREPLCGVPRV